MGRSWKWLGNWKGLVFFLFHCWSRLTALASSVCCAGILQVLGWVLLALCGPAAAVCPALCLLFWAAPTLPPSPALPSCRWQLHPTSGCFRDGSTVLGVRAWTSEPAARGLHGSPLCLCKARRTFTCPQGPPASWSMEDSAEGSPAEPS